MDGIIKCCCGEDCLYYDDKVRFVSSFIIHSLEHPKHKNFLLAMIEASKLLHKLLESNYSQEEEGHWRPSYYIYSFWNFRDFSGKDKVEAWGTRYVPSIRRARFSNINDNDMYYFIRFLLDDSYEGRIFHSNLDVYVLRSWYDKHSLFNWTFPFAILWTAISFAIFFGVLGIILFYTYLIADICVAFFVVLSLLCASAVTAITLFIVSGIKLKAAGKKVEARKLTINNNKEDFHTEFIKSNMWW